MNYNHQRAVGRGQKHPDNVPFMPDNYNGPPQQFQMRFDPDHQDPPIPSWVKHPNNVPYEPEGYDGPPQQFQVRYNPHEPIEQIEQIEQIDQIEDDYYDGPHPSSIKNAQNVPYEPENYSGPPMQFQARPPKHLFNNYGGNQTTMEQQDSYHFEECRNLINIRFCSNIKAWRQQEELK